MTLLDISQLTLDLPGGIRLLDGVSLTVAAGETVGLVGESGSGKSLTARSVLGLLPAGSATTGSIHLAGHSVLDATPAQILELRRTSASMIFQDPRSGINPMRTIGDHLTEVLRLCRRMPVDEAETTALALLEAVRLPRPAEHLRQYPHELSGGMLQRAMIAGALTSSPQLLICDEPTTALDVTTQAEIIAVLAEQRASRGMGMLFITHDLNLAASICDRVAVLSAGRVVEQGGAREVFLHPKADYTRRLLAATPTLPRPRASIAVADVGTTVAATATATTATADTDTDTDTGTGTGTGTGTDADAMLSVRSLSKTYHRRGKESVPAVVEASIEIPRGGALGVVGESGSGKSTLARMIVGLERADAGDIRIAGSERTIARSRAERLAHARSVQMVFQDPYLSLDPRMTAGRAIEDALRLHASSRTVDARAQVLALLDQVGLGEKHAQARPRTLSGGQRQRVAIARALAIEPDLLVLDEATSALDVSVQAQVLGVVERIRRERGLTVLFISHDLAVVRRVCEQTVVMKTGVIVERGRTDDLLEAPRHPYTRLLIESVPRPDWDGSERPRAESAV
ncbi:dipeptide ABC transporter ATP-binding protein [Leifsonia sp. Leaf264]|uniref:dipeptide ABC transporter ATP-binding protein n=1 Tax=Leifsonia sp. Leaf264 TaxID=1736314 RepID=UPI0006FD9632|nr:ABC transporter ATP-binding protein [Leifsonia sp. Leaf264]KQO96972.1 ABC transporter ATP-binding protein [Leifsonia sp. Leaf264]